MKKRLFKLLKKIISEHYFKVIIVTGIITVVFLVISFNLEIKASWLAMVPENNPVVVEFKTLLSEFGNAEGIIVVVEAEEESQLPPVIEEIALEIGENVKDIKNIHYRTPREFIRKHGLIIQKEKDLISFKDILKDPNLVPLLISINDNLEKEYIEESGAGIIKKERDAVFAVSGIKEFIDSLNRYLAKPSPEIPSQAAEEFLLGPEYFFSRERTRAILIIIPAVSSIDYEKAVVIVNQIDNKLSEITARYPGIRAGITGMHVIARDEMETGTTDTITNMVLAIVFISLLFILSFRMVSSPLLAMFNLIVGIIWTVGLTTLMLGEMDILTLMITVALIGLGIDYSIHILSTYSEARFKGYSPEESICWSIDKSASGIITGGLTTAIAFFSLVFTSFKGFREFGVVMSVGILSVLSCSLVLLPSLLIIKDKHIYPGKKMKTDRQPFINALSRLSEFLSAGIKPFLIVGFILILTVFLFLKARDLGFDSNLMNLEAKGLKSVELQDVLEEHFDISADGLFVTSNSLEENLALTRKIEGLQTVSVIESISYYLPTSEEQGIRKPYLVSIRETARNFKTSDDIDLSSLEEELGRLESNLYELSDMSYISGLDRLTKYLDDFLNLDKDGKKQGPNPFDEILDKLDEENLISFQKGFAPVFTEITLDMTNDSEVTTADIPESLRSLFISDAGNKYMITFYSSENLWKKMDSACLNAYRQKIKESITGMPFFIKIIIEVGRREGRTATIIAFLSILFLVIIDLRDIRLTILAMIPLVMGAVWMLGLMELIGQEFNMVNILSVPLIIGIGIDDGIHIIHRYLIEGKGKLGHVIKSTGRAVILTSLTTMLAFGSLVTARYQGYASFGIVITLGVLSCLILSLFMIPALLKIFYEKLNWKLPVTTEE